MVSKLVLIQWHFYVLRYCCRWRILPPAAPPISIVSFLGYFTPIFWLCLSLWSSLPMTFTPFPCANTSCQRCLSLCSSIPVTFTPFLAVQIPATTFLVSLNILRYHILRALTPCAASRFVPAAVSDHHLLRWPSQFLPLSHSTGDSFPTYGSD